MQSGNQNKERRRQDRTRAVIPIRVRGNDASGKRFDDLAHTLDITPTGARLGSIRHSLTPSARLTITYRQRRIEFEVRWIRQIAGTGEYQIGIKALSQDGDAWGVSNRDSSSSSREKLAPALAGALA